MHYNDVQYLFSSSGPTYTAVGQLKNYKNCVEVTNMLTVKFWKNRDSNSSDILIPNLAGLQTPCKREPHKY